MIWGEIINAVRKLHWDLAEEFSVDAQLYTRDHEIHSLPIPFPEAVDDFDEWDEIALPEDLQELLPLHPVERALIEGPLLPIQKIRFASARQVEQLFGAIVLMERSWLDQTQTFSPDKLHFIETFCSIQTLKISVRAGFQRLAPLKER